VLNVTTRPSKVTTAAVTAVLRPKDPHPSIHCFISDNYAHKNYKRKKGKLIKQLFVDFNDPTPV